GGVGKSALRLLQLMSMALDRPLCGQHVFRRSRVLVGVARVPRHLVWSAPDRRPAPVVQGMHGAIIPRRAAATRPGWSSCVSPCTIIDCIIPCASGESLARTGACACPSM